MLAEKLIEPVSGEAPAGEEGAYTLAFQELGALAEYLAARLELAECERLAKLEYQGENADSDARVAQSNAQDARRNVERAEAAVKQVTGRAPSADGARTELRTRAERMLLETGKDLRVAQHLALACTLEQGIAGYAQGLQLFDALIERFGAELHPKPDEDDPSDVSAREMVVSEVFHGQAFLQALREAVVLEAPGVGRLVCRDVDVIEGNLEDDRQGTRSASEVAAIAQAAGGGTPEGAAEALRAALERVESCEQAGEALARRFTAGNIHGDRVLKLLESTRKLLASAQQLVQGEPAAADAEAVRPIVTTSSAGGQPQGNGGAMGALRNREDARRLILQISKFLEETEPSHPAPFFLRRAERLLGAKDFFAIMRDMAPDAIGEMERITGHRDHGSEST